MTLLFSLYRLLEINYYIIGDTYSDYETPRAADWMRAFYFIVIYSIISKWIWCPGHLSYVHEHMYYKDVKMSP